MNEKPVPWWRKALNFALGGLRSGFGLFSKAAKPGPLETTEPEVETSAPEEEELLQSSEAPQEVDETLTEPIANPEAIVAVSETVMDTVHEAAIEAREVAAPALEEAEEAAPAAPAVAGEAAREAAAEAEPEAFGEPESAVTWISAPEVAPEKEPEAVIEPVAAIGTIEGLLVPAVDPIVDEVLEPAQPTEDLREAQAEVASEQEPVVSAEARSELEPAPAAPEELVPSIEEAEPEPEPEPIGAANAVESADALVVEATTADPVADPLSEPGLEAVTDLLPEAASGPIAVPNTISHLDTVAASAAAPIAEPTSPPVLVAQPAPDPVADEKAAAKVLAVQKKRDEASEDSPFSVIVDKVYDGPLDLLLDLIRAQDIDIYDIPIARITAQFLAYVNQLKATDVDVAGEFIYTASLLIHIKSKMLLPRSPTGQDDAAEDPRRELVDRLLEHERFKNAAQMLQQKQMLEAATWTNPGFREFQKEDGGEADIGPEIAADTVDLVRVFRDILERARNRPVLDVEEDSVTVGQMIQFLARRLTMEDKPIALRRLLSHTRSERALVAMFLALLELVRLQAVLLRQDQAFSDIFIKKHTGFDAVMNQGLTNALDDWR